MLATRATSGLASMALCCMAIAAPARAQDAGTVRCEETPARRPIEVTPAVGSREVSIDAPVRVRYPRGYFDPEGPGGDIATTLSVRRCSATSAACDLLSCAEEDGEFVPGRVQVLGEELVFVPDEEWIPSQAYAGLARGVEGDLPFQFCVGSSRDTMPPRLGRIEELTSTSVEPRCDAPEGGFRVAAFFRIAEESGPPGSVEYLLFQTRGAGIDEPVLRDRVRNFAATETVPMAFVLPPGEATDVICVRAAAVDGVGNIDWSDDNPDADCVDPVQGNFFYGLCSASAPGSGDLTALGVAVFGALVLALVIRRPRGRARFRSGT